MVRPKQKESLSRWVNRNMRAASKRIQRAVDGSSDEAEVPWRDRTCGFVAALELAKGAVVFEKARELAASGPQTNILAPIVVMPTIASAAEWESQARALEGRIIDVQALPAKDQK